MPLILEEHPRQQQLRKLTTNYHLKEVRKVEVLMKIILEMISQAMRRLWATAHVMVALQEVVTVPLQEMVIQTVVIMETRVQGVTETCAMAQTLTHSRPSLLPKKIEELHAR